MFIKHVSSPIIYIDLTHCCIWDMQVFIISQWQIISLSTGKSGGLYCLYSSISTRVKEMIIPLQLST